LSSKRYNIYVKQDFAYIYFNHITEMVKSQSERGGLNMKKIAILGDSYSTYEGYIPKDYDYWYGSTNALQNDVAKVEDLWWYKVCSELGYELVVNCSFSGSTVCYSGYPEMDGEATSFITRMYREFQELKEFEIKPDWIIIFGGTNDFWAESPIGNIQYGTKLKDELFSFAPAFCCVMEYMIKNFPDSRITAIVNDDITSDIRMVQKEVCNHFGVELIELQEIEKQNGHPSKCGMQQIADALIQMS